jgi:hypothetical protein
VKLPVIIAHRVTSVRPWQGRAREAVSEMSPAPGTLEATIVRLLQGVNRPGGLGVTKRLRAAGRIGSLGKLRE